MSEEQLSNFSSDDEEMCAHLRKRAKTLSYQIKQKDEMLKMMIDFVTQVENDSLCCFTHSLTVMADCKIQSRDY